MYWDTRLVLFLSLLFSFTLANSELVGVTLPTDECSSFTDCNACTSHSSWTGRCEYCEVPEPYTVIITELTTLRYTGAVCHDPYSPVNPCNLFCSSFNVYKPQDCPKTSPPPTYYDPKEAEMLLHLSSAAYSNYPDVCFQNLRGESHWQVYAPPITVDCDFAGYLCFSYTALSTKIRAIAVAFRGSTSFGQVLDELAAGSFPKKAWEAGGSVVSYFSEAFGLLWPQLSAQIKALVKANPGYKVYVTGHSLGGALASLAASRMVYENITSNPIVYTFGQPRVGDYAYAHEFDSKVKSAWRVVHYADPVPHCPICGEFPWDPAICNPCGSFHNGYHHGREIWYNTTHFFFRPDSKFSNCSGWIRNEDVQCSNSQVHVGIPCLTPECLRYHTFYFGMSVGECGYSNCSNIYKCENY